MQSATLAGQVAVAVAVKVHDQVQVHVQVYVGMGLDQPAWSGFLTTIVFMCSRCSKS